jgi:membrane protease YdiL (CAAX protease family)
MAISRHKGLGESVECQLFSPPSETSIQEARTSNHRKGIVAFLLIAFGMAWTFWEISIRLVSSHKSPLLAVLAFVGGFSPAVAAFIVRKWVTHEGFADAKLRLNLKKWPYYLVGWLLPFVVVGCITLLAPLFGFGRADLSLTRGINYMIQMGVPASKLVHPFLLVALWPIQAIFVAPILFGEEFGWRGYLQPRLFPRSPVPSAVVTGIIWAYWHLPLNLRGGNFPDNPRLGALVMFPVAAILLSIIFGWLVLRTGSIWSSSLAHAATNSIGGGLFVLLFGGGANFLFVSYAGLLGWIPLGALSAWIVLTGQLSPATEKTNIPTAVVR